MLTDSLRLGRFLVSERYVKFLTILKLCVNVVIFLTSVMTVIFLTHVRILIFLTLVKILIFLTSVRTLLFLTFFKSVLFKCATKRVEITFTFLTFQNLPRDPGSQDPQVLRTLDVTTLDYADDKDADKNDNHVIFRFVLSLIYFEIEG